MFYVLVFLGYAIWFRAGGQGLKTAAMVGAILLVGMGVHNFLNTFWSKKTQKKQSQAPSYEKPAKRSRFHMSRKASPPETSDLEPVSMATRRRARTALASDSMLGNSEWQM